MHDEHKIFCIVVFLVTVIACYFLGARVTEVVSQLLITFFSVVFGFYMTSIAIFYDSSYAKKLYKLFDKKKQTTYIYVLKSYLLNGGYCIISSIVATIIFMSFAPEGNSCILTSHCFNLNILSISISADLSLLFSSIIFGISAINILFMMLILNTALSAMVTEASEPEQDESQQSSRTEKIESNRKTEFPDEVD